MRPVPANSVTSFIASFFGIRLNVFTAIVVVVGALIYLVVSSIVRPGRETPEQVDPRWYAAHPPAAAEPDGTEVPAGVEVPDVAGEPAEVEVPVAVEADGVTSASPGSDTVDP